MLVQTQVREIASIQSVEVFKLHPFATWLAFVLPGLFAEV